MRFKFYNNGLQFRCHLQGYGYIQQMVKLDMHKKIKNTGIINMN
ncbi:hypothetical protein CBB_2200 [Clostridium botulinum Bf]|nr:hypothetical protein CBB_2200 [Clostridium botulinum Bf]